MKGEYNSCREREKAEPPDCSAKKTFDGARERCKGKTKPTEMGQDKPGGGLGGKRTKRGAAGRFAVGSEREECIT